MSEDIVKTERLPSGAACTSCRRRKNRCDGVRPKCNSCQMRGIHCQYPAVLASQLSIEELKACIEVKLRGPHAPRTPGQPSELRRVDEEPQRAITGFERNEDINALPRTPGNGSGLSSEPFSNPVPDQEPIVRSLRSAQQEAEYLNTSSIPGSPEPHGYFGESSSFDFVSKVVPDAAEDGGQNSKRKRQRHSELSKSYGRRTERDPEWDSCYELPDRVLADSLVDAYFHRVHPLYPFVHEASFRADYERIWLHPRTPLQHMRPELFGILNMVFANGCEFCNMIPPEQILATASGFVARSRRLVLSRAFQTGSLELVQALLLLCHHLQGTMELNECWNLVGLMIRTAIGVGLHLNPSSEVMTALEMEVRKRVWWGCIAVDRTLSMKFGRPPSYRGADVTNVDPPAAVDDQYITSQTLTPRQPTGRHSLMEFFIQTIKLSHIIDGVLWDLYRPEVSLDKTSPGSSQTPQASRISHLLGCTVHLDGQLLSWWHNIPPHLKVAPDTPDGADFQRQRNVLYMRFLNSRIVLHRQAFLLFCRQKLEDRFQRDIVTSSSRECIACARETIRFICLQFPRRLLNALSYNLHFVFTSMGVLLSLQSVDRAKLDALGLKYEEETLKWGMDFLKAASSGNTAAARYVRMLQKLQRRPGAHDYAPTNGGDFGTPAIYRHGNVAEEHLELVDDAPWMSGRQDDSDGNRFPPSMNIDFLDFDDLLSGTGLPRDFISDQWLSSDAFA